MYIPVFSDVNEQQSGCHLCSWVAPKQWGSWNNSYHYHTNAKITLSGVVI